MFNDEDYILDIKVEDRAMEIGNNFKLSQVYEIDDIDSNCSTATGMRGQQKNVRVLIKKLPQKVLNKCFTETNLRSSMTPSRTSKRLKIAPAKYRFLNIDKSHQEPSKHKTATDMKQSHNIASKSTAISKNSITISKTKIDKKSNKSPNETHTEVSKNDPVIVDSSKILVIKQPHLKNDPLNIPNNIEKLQSNGLQKSNSNRVAKKEMESDDDNESEIVERVYFSSKSVQTKFTCNGSICGLVDSDEFNLNCFYCYEIFPLHKWLEFKEHVKLEHNVEEKQIPQQMMTNDVQEPSENKIKVNRITVKSTEDLNTKTPMFSTEDINKEKLPSNYTNMNSTLKGSINNCLTVMPKKQTLKNPASYINLDQSNKKSSPTKLLTNQQLKQSKELTDKSNKSEEFLDLTADNKTRTRSSSIDDLSKSCADEIISIGEDEEEDNEFNEIIENFSKEFLDKDRSNEKALNASRQNSTIKISAAPTANSAPQIKVPNLPNISIRKLEALKTPSSSVQTPQTSSALNKAYIKLTVMPKKQTLKNPASYINLDQSNKKSSPTKLLTNQQLKQSKELTDKSNKSEEFLDLTADNKTRTRSSSIDDLSKSCADEIISIGEDEEEDNEFNEIIENFSKEFLDKDRSNEKALNASRQNSTIKISAAPTANSAPQIKVPNLPNISIRKLEALKTPSSSVQTPQTSSALNKAYIKLPINLSIEEVLKTIPKPTISPQNSTSLSQTKPRYFVVKKVVRQIPAENTPKINLPKDTIMTKIPSLKENDDDDDMPSNDENEDEIPKPTNGCGILFGLTHRDVVIQFLLKLKTYPELWRPHIKSDENINYDQSIEELCQHLNHRFGLSIENFEMRLSIQRVKDWYCRMLKNIFLHNQNRSNIEPYKHTFPEYFKILNKFLTSDVHYTKNLLLSKSSKSSNSSMSDYPKWMMNKVANTQLVDEKLKVQSPLEQTKLPKAPSPKKPIIKFKAKKLPDDDFSQNVIEFDADALYGDSTDDEKPKRKPRWRPMYPFKYKYQYPKRTKVYCPVAPIVCDVCGRNFKRNIDLRRHRVGHFPPKFQCALCSQMFHHKHWAEKCSHGKRKKQYTYTDEGNDGNLIMVTPTKIKSRVPKLNNFRKWMCEMCGVSYRSVGSLNAHKRDKHLNQRLKCVVCKFTAVTNYRIVQHQKKRHIVEPGTVEEVAKKCRARMDSKTPFTPEARQEFDWRREQKNKLNPGELFYGCCKCRIIFQTRKEKVLHNKLEHPIKDTTVICLLCHPEKVLFSNSNSVRRHYTDIHKVPWDEIDDLVKRTKPIFQLLDKDEIDILNSSKNYSELLNELLIKKQVKLDPDPVKEDEIGVLPKEKHNSLVDVRTESTHEGDVNVYVDGIVDHDYNSSEDENYNYEHDYNDNREYNNYQADVSNDNDVYNDDNDEQINVNNDDDENDDDSTHTKLVIHSQSNDQEDEVQNEACYTIDYDGELVEESIVVEEFVADDFIDEDTIEEYF